MELFFPNTTKTINKTTQSGRTYFVKDYQNIHPDKNWVTLFPLDVIEYGPNESAPAFRTIGFKKEKDDSGNEIVTDKEEIPYALHQVKIGLVRKKSEDENIEDTLEPWRQANFENDKRWRIVFYYESEETDEYGKKVKYQINQLNFKYNGQQLVENSRFVNPSDIVIFFERLFDYDDSVKETTEDSLTPKISEFESIYANVLLLRYFFVEEKNGHQYARYPGTVVNPANVIVSMPRSLTEIRKKCEVVECIDITNMSFDEDSSITIGDDVLLTDDLGNKLFSNNVSVTLNGGNLYRLTSKALLPREIQCKNGDLIDVPVDHDLEYKEFSGATDCHLINPGPNTCLDLVTSQINMIIDIDLWKFINKGDYEGSGNARSINLANILERLFKALRMPNPNNQRLYIRFPGNQHGHANYFIDRSVSIPQNTVIDMCGAHIYIDKFDAPAYSALSFETNPVYPILCFAEIRNATIKVLHVHTNSTKDYPEGTNEHIIKTIFDLRNFKGVMEDITFEFENATDSENIYLMLQPYGTPQITYSDRKIIRRCVIHNPSEKRKKPFVLFCQGDGDIIEQCVLSYVGVIEGKSVTVKGCLNDRYLFFNSAVDFSGSYWECGQFEFMGTKALFSACRLDAAVNIDHVIGTDTNSYYEGPWMSIDTQRVRDKVLSLLDDINILDNRDSIKDEDEKPNDNFNEICKTDKYKNLHTVYKAHNYTVSTVQFTPTVRASFQFWGLSQPQVSQLIEADPSARIIGLENLATKGNIPLVNFADSFYGNNPIKLMCDDLRTIPLVNGCFVELGKDVTVPSNVTIDPDYYPYYIDKNFRVDNDDIESDLGLDWEDDEYLDEFSLQFLLDEKRNLYSEPIKSDNRIHPADNKLYDGLGRTLKPSTEDRTPAMPQMQVSFDPKEIDSDLKCEMTFLFTKGNSSHCYRFRAHILDAQTSNFICYSRDSNGHHSLANNMVKQKDFSTLTYNFLIGKSKLGKLEQNSDNQSTSAQGLSSLIALCDYHGNHYMPMMFLADRNYAKRLERTSSSTVRAYCDELPKSGEWSEGDEVVLPEKLYRRFNGKWHELTSTTNSTGSGNTGGLPFLPLPVDPVDPIIGRNPVNP